MPTCRALSTTFWFVHPREYSRCARFNLKSDSLIVFVRIFRFCSMKRSRFVGFHNSPASRPSPLRCCPFEGLSRLLPNKSKLWAQNQTSQQPSVEEAMSVCCAEILRHIRVRPNLPPRPIRILINSQQIVLI